MRHCLAILPFLFATQAWANAPALLPPSVREMLEAAIANGNETEIATVAKIAKQTHDTVIREARFTELWTGKLEAGGFRSTGSTSEIGISAAAQVKREGLEWSHKLSATVDYRRANGVTSRERYTASYEPRYQFDPRGFAYGLTQFERDPSIGYDERYTASAGIGYKVIVSKPIDLSLDVGPSVRHAKYVIGPRETKLGARASMDLAWRLAPNVTFKQTAAGYAETDVFSVNSLTQLQTKVSTRLSAGLSYTVQYESETLLSARDFDTLSRLTLSYDF